MANRKVSLPVLTSNATTYAVRLTAMVERLEGQEVFSPGAAQKAYSKLHDLSRSFVAVHEGLLTANGASEDNIEMTTKVVTEMMPRVDALEMRLADQANPVMSLADQTEEPRTMPKIAFKLFVVDDPELWFLGFEMQLEAKGVVSQKFKFTALLQFLTDEQSLIVAPITRSRDERVVPYDDAKAALTRHYAKSFFDRMKRAFKTETRAEDEPVTQFGARIQNILGPDASDHNMKFIILESLQTNVAIMLRDEKYERATWNEFAMAADEFLAAAQTDSSTGLAAAVQRPKQKKSEKKAKGGKRTCTIHLAYGEKARSCLGPERCSSYEKGLRIAKMTFSDAGNAQGAE